jgi:ubiquinone/menaquinone biosynthesis C-methylase UbiE
MNVEAAVRERYSQAAQQAEASLCCPVNYNPRFLQALPQEILERDYGCGDPSRHVDPGDVVLDLGSGGGKICYIAAQIVGSEGQVIGVDMNEDMLSLARKYQSEMARKIGHENVTFRRGKIQDLALDLDQLEAYLREQPVHNAADWLRVEEHARHLRETSPMVANDSVDVIVSNCVLNLVRAEDRQSLFSEMHRALKRGGRAVISDIVCDEVVPEHLRQDPKLWSGCLSGAFQEEEFLAAFESAGFYGMEIVDRQTEPWAVIEGIEFRSLTVRAWKGKAGPCLERKQAVIYNGPWKAVIDDDGHKLLRGARMAVCDKTFRIYTNSPYAESITPVPPAKNIPLNQAEPFDCLGSPKRPPRETKQQGAGLTILPEGDCCGPADCC